MDKLKKDSTPFTVYCVVQNMCLDWGHDTQPINRFFNNCRPFCTVFSRSKNRETNGCRFATHRLFLVGMYALGMAVLGLWPARPALLSTPFFNGLTVVLMMWLVYDSRSNAVLKTALMKLPQNVGLEHVHDNA